MIDEVTPGERLVFRRRPEGAGRPHTRVSITLEDAAEGTPLVLVEDGFATAPAEDRDEMIDGNSQGWDEDLEELRAMLEARAA